VPLALEREALTGLLQYTNSEAIRVRYRDRIRAIEMRLATEFDGMSVEIDPDQT
jgi:hypothetical protein